MKQKQATYLMMSAVILLAAFLLFLYHIDSESIWQPEMRYVTLPESPAQAAPGWRSIARNTFDELRTTIITAREQGHMPLYPVMMVLWQRLFGLSEFMLRLPSALAAVIATAGAIALAHHLIGRRVALAAGVVFAVVPSVVFFSREVHPAMLALSLSLWALIMSLRTGKRYTLLYILLMSAAILTAPPAAIFALLHVTDSILKKRKTWLADVGVLALCAPWLWLAHPLTLSAALPVDSPSQAFGILTGGVVLLWLILIMLAIPRLLRLPRTKSALLLIGAIIALLPLLIPADMALILSAPFWCAIVASGIVHLPLPESRWRIGVTLVLLALSVRILLANTPPPDFIKPAYHHLLKSIAAQRNPLDVMLVTLPPDHPFFYYDRLHRVTDGVTVRTGWQPELAGGVLAQIIDSDNPRALWLVTENDSLLPDDYEARYTTQFSGIMVRHLVPLTP